MKYKVTLNGRTYEVEVEAGKAMCVAEYEAFAPAAAPVAAPEAEAEVEDEMSGSEAVTIRRADNAAFIVEGEWAEKLVNRVNFSDKESLMYFERSLIKGGIIDRLRAAGCEEGDTVCVCGIEFDFIE